MQTASSADRTEPGAADLAACRALLANGSRTFLAASLLMPRAVRDPACALYAYCRVADDAVDAGTAPLDAVARLRERLDRVYAGRPDAHAADRAFARVVERFEMPRALPEALIEGFAWDAAGRRYATLADVQAYAARVAGSVGAMMAVLMGVRSASGLARACDLGVAMQLSNIARDVGEDARMGRLYLPARWLGEAGLDADAWLARPVWDPALGRVVRRVLDAADELYARVGAGIAELPPACRPSIHAARLLYAAIGHQVARDGLNSVDRRAVVGKTRKCALLIAALGASLVSAPPLAAPPLAATRFLVDAAARDAAPVAPLPARWNLAARGVWLIALFERLERREQGRMAGLH